MILQPEAGCSSYALLDSPEVQRDAELFASSCVQTIDTSNEVMCVIQGEVAAASPGDGPTGLGSDSATTCHIVAFRNPATGRTCLAHLDDPNKVAEAIASMLRLVSVGGDGDDCSGEGKATAAGQQPLDLYVVGGYLGKSCSEKLSHGLFSALDRSRRTFRVVLACMARLNSASTRRGEEDGNPQIPRCSGSQYPSLAAADGASSAVGGRAETHLGGSADDTDHCGGWFPRQTGLAIDLASGQAYPARFEGAGRGPAWEVRSSRIFAGSREEALTEIYEPRADSIVVSPFPVFVEPRWLLRMLVLSDGDLLAKTSTSPEVEEERFVEDIRAQFSYMLAHSGADGGAWLENVFGAGRGRPLVFRRGEAEAAAAAAVVAVAPGTVKNAH